MLITYYLIVHFGLAGYTSVSTITIPFETQKSCLREATHVMESFKDAKATCIRVTND